MLTVVAILALACSVTCFNDEVDEKFRNLPHDEFIKFFNGQNFSYKIAHYDDINEKAVSCSDGFGVRPSFVTVPIPIPVPVNVTQRYGLANYVPPEFDGREYRPDCYSMPVDQGECASCWAIATATVAAIRRCTHIFWPPFPIGVLKPLSAADLICCKDCYNESFCGEGSPDKAALFWLSNGLVPEVCKPYKLNVHKNETSDCKEVCVNDTSYYNAEKYFGHAVYVVLKDDHEIRREIVYRGPVVATFVLYEDFRDYKEGVYEHTHGEPLGYHTVAVIGFGTENGVPYWLATNTWGAGWGENSTFKIKRFTSDLGFENHMLSLIPRMGLP